MPPTTSAASAPPSPASPLPTAKVIGEQKFDVDPEARGDARIVDRRPQPRAEAGLDQENLQRRGDHATDADDEQPIDADADAVKLDASGEPCRQVDLLRLIAEEVVRDRHRHDTRPMVNRT